MVTTDLLRIVSPDTTPVLDVSADNDHVTTYFNNDPAAGVASVQVLSLQAINGDGPTLSAVNGDDSANTVLHFRTQFTSFDVGDVRLVHGLAVLGGVSLVGLQFGTLLAPPAGLGIGDSWLDTTDSAAHPILRVSQVIT